MTTRNPRLRLVQSPLGDRQAETSQPAEEEPRYRGPDRRGRPTPMISRYTFRGRRRQVRRTEDGQGGYYVDRFARAEVLAVVILLTLTITDAVATLYILSRGGVEMNPLMRNALDVSNSYFLFAKLGISLIGATLILIHTRFPGVRTALYLLLLLYGGVVIYHGVLMTRFL